MRVSSNVRSRQTASYAVDSLHALPCGCVAAVYRTQPFDLDVIAVEARGPHCVNRQHEMGSVLGVGTNEAGRLSR